MSRVTLLALDIGNTSLTLGLFRDGELIGSWRATTRTGATPDEAAALVHDMLALDAHRLDQLTAVGIASVQEIDEVNIYHARADARPRDRSRERRRA